MRRRLVVSFDLGRIDEIARVSPDDGWRTIVPKNPYGFFNEDFKGREGTVCDTGLFLYVAFIQLYRQGAYLVLENKAGTKPILL